MSAAAAAAAAACWGLCTRVPVLRWLMLGLCVCALFQRYVHSPCMHTFYLPPCKFRRASMAVSTSTVASPPLLYLQALMCLHTVVDAVDVLY